MAARLIEPTQVIEVNFVPIMIYGPASSGKTALAQTAKNPLTLDFDKGIHRCHLRKTSMDFDCWNDCIEAGKSGVFDRFDSLIIDTAGRALDVQIPDVLKESSKNGYAGGLSPQGWGILGRRFITWLKTVSAMGKQIVLICHEEESKNSAGDSRFGPDMTGQMSWKEIHKSLDLVGRIRYEGRNRILDFNPSDTQIAKNAARWEAMPLPDLEKNPTFLADLIADAKVRIGKTAQASAAVAQQVEQWQTRLEQLVGTDELNSILPEMKEFPPNVKKQVWAITEEYAEKHNLQFDKTKKAFVEGACSA